MWPLSADVFLLKSGPKLCGSGFIYLLYILIPTTIFENTDEILYFLIFFYSFMVLKCASDVGVESGH